jgi:hypothetical protein
VLDSLDLVAAGGGGQQFVGGGQAIFENIGVGVNQYLHGGSSKVSNDTLRKAFQQIENGNSKAGFRAITAYEQGDKTLQPFLDNLPITVTASSYFFPPICPFSTCKPNHDFGDTNNPCVHGDTSYLNYDQRMKWLGGVFTDDFYLMIKNDPKTLNAWMRTDSNKLGAELERLHEKRESTRSSDCKDVG